ncbi:class F sortase [Streptomyces sediminimaris]|uniref:class F sortase n=1 Tax=Streptomyces sediminimaris TaxID=3383721 RepID=UPI00399A1161
MAQPPSSTDDEPVPAAPGSSRSGAMMMCVAAGLVLVAGLVNGHGDSTGSAGPAVAPRPAAAAPRSAGTSEPRPATTGAVRPVGKHLPRSAPVRLRIPKIWVDAPFTDLYIGPNGHLQPPPAADTNLVGWHAKGASPGETGTAVIAGHVDTKTSAAVFANLGELKKGDVFYVDRADGSTATFKVDDAETFAKSDFPSDRVYDDTPRAEARLITCAGDYDHSAHDYTDNLVVFAHLV